MKRHHLQRIALGLCGLMLAACSASDSASIPVEGVRPEAPTASPESAQSAGSLPAPATPTPVATTAAKFASAPAQAWIIRSNCRMGACSWMRYEQVMRNGSDDAPIYDLRLTLGESQHPQDPYPNRPDDVIIQWQSGLVPAQVKCSLTAPYAMAGQQSDLLKLSPQGVAGASQGLANLYFATCHGEYGDDAELARKFGYDVR